MKIQKTATALLALLAALAAPLRALDTTILHNFSGGASDGAEPSGSLTLVGNTLYGIAGTGGTYDVGTIFKVNADGTGFAILHSFNPATEGRRPLGALVASGNTLYGLANFDAWIFKINTDGSGYATANINVGENGSSAIASLAISGNKLYGMVQGGGGNAVDGSTGHGNGNIFSINTDFTGLTNLHSFDGGGDGGIPKGTPTISGTTLYGMAFRTIYKINTNGSNFTVIHHFAGGTTDGDEAYSSLTLAGDKLYGMTRNGGADNRGTIFSVNTDGSGFTILHSFTPDTTFEGYNPESSLTLLGSTLYGTTRVGGTGTGGTVFQIKIDGSGYQVLHNFQFNTPDGILPYRVDPTPSADGLIFYGTTQGGGSGGRGTIFALPLHPAFFNGEVALGGGVYYLAFPGNGNIFGYYQYQSTPGFLYHYDLGFEYVFDLGSGGVVFYDFKSDDYFYASPTFAFPYLYDFGLGAFLYYYPDPTNPQRYNTNGVRYFYNFTTGKIISK